MSSVSALGASPTMLQALQRVRGELDIAQTESSSGRRADVGLTLGGRVAQSLDLRRLVASNDTYRASNDMLQMHTASAQVALGAMSQSAASLRNQALQAITSGDAANLGLVAQGALADAFTKMNSEVAGRYLFSGEANDAPAVLNQGAQGKAAIAAAFTSTFGFPPGSPAASSISGAAMSSFLDTQFSNLFQPSNWATDWVQGSTTAQQADIAPGQRVAASVTAHEDGMRNLVQGMSMLSELGISSLSVDARQSVLTHAATSLSQGADGVTQAQARLGAVQRRASEASDSMASQSATLQTQIGTLENVDPAEAAMRVSRLTTQLETSYALTARLSKLSLVNYL